MNRYVYHIIFVSVISSIVLLINIMAFYSKDVTDYLYIFDLTYAIGNSAHFVALSITPNGINIEDEKKAK